MAQTSLNIRIDEDVKKQGEALFAELGMNMTTAINVFLRQAIRAGGIPFDVNTRADGFFNEYNQKRLDKAIADIEAGKGKRHELIEVDDD